MKSPYGTPTDDDQQLRMAAAEDLPHRALTELSGQPGGWIALALLLGLFALADLGVAPLMHVFQQRDWGAVWVYACAGAIGAQAGLLTFVLVFVPGPYWIRLSFVGLAGLIFFGCWAAGLAMSWPSYAQPQAFHETVRLVAFSLPLVAIAVQTPLWPLRIYFGWRLAPVIGDASDRSPRISDYLLATALVAVAFTLARLAPTGNMPREYWLVWSIVAGSFAGISLLSIVPAMLLVLRWRWWGAGLAILVLYALAALAITLAVAAIASPTFRNELQSPGMIWIICGFAIVFATYALLLGAGLRALAAALGCRLVLRRKAQSD